MNRGFDFVVLGATGIQGKIVSRDLLENGYSVLLCGRDKKRVEKILKKYKKTGFEYVEMSNTKNLITTLKNSGADIVINCVEGDWNLVALDACVKLNKHSIDLGSEIWMTKKQLAMYNKLKKRNLIHITGCGSVPGVGNIMLKHASQEFDKIDTIEVGFAWDSNIKQFVVPFSIQSILAEFTDPAPVIESRHFKKRVPLDSIIEDYHRAIGKQKEFFARHPETFTFYHYFKNKGLKNVRFYAGFPQHSFEKIMTMIDLGFARKDEISFRGIKVKPAEFLTELLKDLKIPEGYKEKENLWVRVYGTKKGKKEKRCMECIVPTLRGWEDAGCNIDTGMPASIIAQMIKTGIIDERGSFAPEAVVPPEPFFKELRKRRMRVFENGKVIN